MKKVVIIGGRIDGQCGVVLDTLSILDGYQVIGILDNTPGMTGTLIKGIPVIGSSTKIEDLSLPNDCLFHIAIGDNLSRNNLLKELKKFDRHILTIIHPTAFISKTAQIGAGCFVGPLAVVNNSCEIGDAAIINSGVIVEHDNILGNTVHLAPGVKTGGRVKIENNSFIGLGSCILPDIIVGNNAIVGAGSTVVKNVESRTTIYGFAARIRGKNIYQEIEQNDLL
jgi:acetyltransferase EpsM